MKKPYGIIYRARSKTSGKVYIGQTRQKLETRMRQHKCDSKTRAKTIILYNAINKYGWGDFEWLELFQGRNQRELNLMEIYCISEVFNSQDDRYGYNIRGGGSNGKMGEETKKKLRIARLGSKHTEEFIKSHRKRFSGKGNPRWGAKLSKETRAKISARAKGRISPMRIIRDNKSIIDLYFKSLSCIQISKIVGISHYAIRKEIKLVGLKLFAKMSWKSTEYLNSLNKEDFYRTYKTSK